MSFREYLIEHGFNKEQADGICIMAEFELPMSELEEELYWDWRNREWLNVDLP